MDEDIQHDFIQCLDKHKLTTSQYLSCEGLLTAEECLSALSGMAAGRSPGWDGLPKEFYVTFWATLGEDMVHVLNHAYQGGVLPYSQRMAVISLVHKKGPRFMCQNWRPISLLTADYKVASRAIAIRLKKVISQVVNPDQTCAIPGRFIGENIRLVQDAIRYADSRNIPLAILSLDQEKAFDRVDWQYMLCVLSGLGFGPDFIKWVTLFYTMPMATVKVNGFFSAPFILTRGVRQGCPLSAALYVLVSESLSARLRSVRALRGLPLPDSDEAALVSQYADDTTVFVTTDHEMELVFRVYKLYEKASGAKLNLEKCKGLWCGSWKGRSDPPVNLQWSSESIVILGVAVGNTPLVAENWASRIAKLERVLNSWRQRSLSFQGKALVLNALALSGLWYTASVLVIPPLVLADLKSLIFAFFWSGKTESISRDVVCLPLDLGGFNLIDPGLKAQALHAVWIRRMLSGEVGKWHYFFRRTVLETFGTDLESVLQCPGFFPHDILPEFYASAMESWALLRGHMSPAGFAFRTALDPSTPVASLTTKLAYTTLLRDGAVTPSCVTRLNTAFPGLDWPMIWSQVHTSPLDRKVRDVSWRVAHGALPTADRLSRHGTDVDLSCFCRKAPESHVHLFYDCQFITVLLLWAQTLFLRVCPLSPTLRARHLLFGFDSSEVDVVPPVFTYLLHLIKYQVWLARNNFRFNGVHPDVIATKASIVSRLNRHLAAFSRSFKSRPRRRFFHRSWNVLGKYSPDIRSIVF